MKKAPDPPAPPAAGADQIRPAELGAGVSTDLILGPEGREPPPADSLTGASELAGDFYDLKTLAEPYRTLAALGEGLRTMAELAESLRDAGAPIQTFED